MKTLGDRIRARRRVLCLTQKELAKKSGLSQTTISDIERGRNVGSREIISLANALLCRVEWLGTGEGPQNALTAQDAEAIEADAQFLRDVMTEARARQIPDHIRLAVLTLLRSAPRKPS